LRLRSHGNDSLPVEPPSREADDPLSNFLASLRDRVSKNPGRAITVVVVALAIGIAVLMVTTSGSDDNAAARREPVTTTKPTPPEPRLKLKIGQVVVRSIGTRMHVRRPLRRALLTKAQRYVDGAIIAPLEDGHATAGWNKVFDPYTRRFARRRDLGEVTEVKTGFRQKRVHATASKVRIDAIGAPNGQPALVALSWTMGVDAVTGKGKLAIRRNTELTFAKEFGQWLVTAYRVDVTRSLGKQKKTSATRAG
jgi:hypothetical protein